MTVTPLYDGQDRQGRRLPPESEGLEPIVFGAGVIGYEPDINGPDAELVEFTPTRAELKTLAYHYLERYFAVQEIFAMGQSGSWEIREAPFAWRRFEAISEALSPGQPIKEFEEYIEKRWVEIDEFEEPIEMRCAENRQRDQEVEKDMTQ